MLVNVIGNTYLNPDAVGKLDFSVTHTNEERVNRTVIYDLSGQHVLGDFKTEVPKSDLAQQHDPVAFKRDNLIHAEIRLALHEQRDARTWNELDQIARTE